MLWITEAAGRYVGLQKAFGVGEKVGKVAIVFELENGSSHGNLLVRKRQPEARGSVSDKLSSNNEMHIEMQSIQRRVTS